ncbi:alpha/beta fold hydrolase [Dyella jiangningensis]|uniref:Alpha/beta hydrolase n=1 Tax=Dyella jiangningensis TaxID=1379159 RepID=A0A328PD26_9GAMM|nr:alpha/beta hydrolase [Dyella jiangningensis]RAO78025.1 alpha/beta hydrolase [Dyella jiangningensis]
MHRRTFLQTMSFALAAGTLGVATRKTLASGSAPTITLDAATYRRERRHAHLPCGDVAYLDRGRGPATLFLHGFPLNSFQWRGVIAQLSGERRCIAPDWLGLGYTHVAPGRAVTPAAQVNMLIALLDLLHVVTVDVVANDSGGAIAQCLMTRHPERVRTLLLTNCDVENDSPPAALQPVIEMSRKGRFVDQWLAPWLADKALARSPQGIGGMCYQFPEHPTDEALDYYLSPLCQPAQKPWVHAYALGLTPNPLAGIEPQLKHSRVPTRILWGTGDDIFSQASPDYLQRTLGNPRGIRRIPGAKLFFPEEYPDVIVEELRRLWAA